MRDGFTINVTSISILIATTTAVQLIIQPPVSTTTALGTNATFTCRGNGRIKWEISGTQVSTKELVELFAERGVYVPLPTPNVSELIMTATLDNNVTRTIRCLVIPGGNVARQIAESTLVHLLVYGKYK